MRPTLRDVARRANVHYSTVSHVINGSDGSTRVSAETRRRVLEAAHALGYRANRAAQQLKTRRSQVVGLLVGALENPFFARMASLCEAALEQAGYDMVLTVRRNDEVHDLHLLQALASRQLDGILLWSETITEARERVQQPDMAHTVVMGYAIPGRDSVSASLETGVQAALEHLAAQGCQRIGYLAPVASLTRPGDPRRDLYCRMTAALGQEPRIYPYEGSSFDMEAARTRAEQIAVERDAPDGLLCFNDMTAIGALMGLRRRGLCVPADIALVGCDNLPLAAQMDTPLTTIDYPLPEMCRTAVGMLLKRMTARAQREEAEPAGHVLLPTVLHVRESSLRQAGSAAILGDVL